MLLAEHVRHRGFAHAVQEVNLPDLVLFHDGAVEVLDERDELSVGASVVDLRSGEDELADQRDPQVVRVDSW